MGDVVSQVHAVAESVLFPSAEATDRAERVPAGHLEALAGAGAFGIAGSVEPVERRQIPSAPRRCVRRHVLRVGAA